MKREDVLVSFVERLATGAMNCGVPCRHWGGDRPIGPEHAALDAIAAYRAAPPSPVGEPAGEALTELLAALEEFERDAGPFGDKISIALAKYRGLPPTTNTIGDRLLPRVKAMMARQPAKVVDAIAADGRWVGVRVPNPPPLHCGQPATRATEVPAWVCGVCAAVFQVRTAPPHTVPPGSEAGQGATAECPTCKGSGERSYCSRCDDSTDDHVCPPCRTCGGDGRIDVPTPPPEVPPAGETTHENPHCGRCLLSLKECECRCACRHRWIEHPMGGKCFNTLRCLCQGFDPRPPEYFGKPAPAPGVPAVCGTCGGRRVCVDQKCLSDSDHACHSCSGTGRPTGERGTR